MEFISDDRFLTDCKWLKELFDRFERNDPGAHLKPIETSIRENKKGVDNTWITGKKLAKLDLFSDDSANASKPNDRTVFEMWESPYMKKLLELSCGSFLEGMFAEAKFDYRDWALSRHKSRSLQDFIDDETKYGDGFCSAAAAALYFHEKEFEDCKVSHAYLLGPQPSF